MKRLDKFKKALNTLDSYSNVDMSNLNDIQKKMIVDGYLSHFERVFELSWKLCKDVLYYEGIDEATSGSPRSIIALSVHYGLISGEDKAQWNEALKERNILIHEYDDDITNNIYLNVKNSYTELFKKLEANIDNTMIDLYLNNYLPESEIDDNFISYYKNFIYPSNPDGICSP